MSESGQVARARRGRSHAELRLQMRRQRLEGGSFSIARLAQRRRLLRRAVVALIGVVVTLAVGLVAGGSTTSVASGSPLSEGGHVGCVPQEALTVPRSRDWIVVSTDGGVSVRVGHFVGLRVTLPEFLPGRGVRIPTGFPWTRPFISRPGVVETAHLCSTSPSVSMLTIVTFFYQAVDPGDVTIVVPLSKHWIDKFSCGRVRPPLCEPLQPLRVEVRAKLG